MKNYIINAVVALLLIIGVGLVAPKAQPAPQQSDVQVSGLSERDIQAVSLKVGPNGNKAISLNWGTCYIDPYAATITGTTTASVDCQGTLAVDARAASGLAGAALPGVTSASSVIAQLSTTTAFVTGTRGLSIVGASASTTPGHIELRISNHTGATYTWSTVAGTASGTVQFIAPR